MAGTSGAAGSAPPPDDVCTRLENDYVAALGDAMRCDPKEKRHVCDDLVDTSLSCPVCKTWVDDKDQLNEIRADWKREHCDRRKPVCSFTRCLNVGPGVCVPDSNNDTQGTCGARVAPH